MPTPVRTFTLIAAGSAAAIALATGCSSDDSDSDPTTPNVVESAVSGLDLPSVDVGAAGNATIEVDGKPLEGVDLSQVGCGRTGELINIGGAGGDRISGFGAVLKDAEPPTVESVAFTFDGQAYGVTSMMGMTMGSATVTVDGDTYTITGTASGVDMANIGDGVQEKPFTIKVDCAR